jgi:cytochrome c oxidase subunit 1
MHRAGLAGVPRRTAEPQYANVEFENVIGGIAEMRLQIAVGGTILFVALLMFLAVVVATWFGERSAKLEVNSELPPALSGPKNSPVVLDDLRIWALIAIVLVAIAYGPPLWSMVADGLFAPGSPPIPV